MSFALMFVASTFFTFGRILEGCKWWKAVFWGCVCFSLFFTGNIMLMMAGEIIRQLLA